MARDRKWHGADAVRHGFDPERVPLRFDDAFGQPDGYVRPLVENRGSLSLLGDVEREVPDLALVQGFGPGRHPPHPGSVRNARGNQGYRVAVPEFGSDERRTEGSAGEILTVTYGAVFVELGDESVTHRYLAELVPVDSRRGRSPGRTVP